MYTIFDLVLSRERVRQVWEDTAVCENGGRRKSELKTYTLIHASSIEFFSTFVDGILFSRKSGDV
jgi:hypothetical protein